MPTRIVKATGSDADYLGHCGEPAKQWRAAFRAKAAAHGISTVRPDRVKARLAFSNSERCRRHPQDGCVRSPCSPLAIAAMAVQRENGGGGTFIADSAAGASAREASQHRSYLGGFSQTTWLETRAYSPALTILPGQKPLRKRPVEDRDFAGAVMPV
jgi:hypothetical protein